MAAALQTGTVTLKDMASLAGILLSFRPAIRFAPMFTRGLYQALQGRYPTAQTADIVMAPVTLQDMQWWITHASQANGRCWWDRQISLMLASDASESCFAAYAVDATQCSQISGMSPPQLATHHGQDSQQKLLRHQDGRPWQMQQAFTAEEAALMKTVTDFSSTLREVR